MLMICYPNKSYDTVTSDTVQEKISINENEESEKETNGGVQ